MDSRITLSSFTEGGGLIAYRLQTAGADSGAMAGDGTLWLGQSAGSSAGDLSSAVASDSYVEFTLSSDDPFQLTRLSFTVGGYGSGSTGYVTVRSDAEVVSFQTDLGTFSEAMNTKSDVKSIDLDLNQDFAFLTDVTFRFYLYDDYVGNNNRRAGFDDLKIEGVVLSAPSLSHPSAGEAEPLTIPYFDWDDQVVSPYPGTYEIEIDDSSDFSSPVDADVIPALISFYSPDFELKTGSTYYWRVRYISESGWHTDWSTSYFTVATPYVVDVAPSDGWTEIRAKLQQAADYSATNSGVAELRFPSNTTFNITQVYDSADATSDYLFYLTGMDDVIINGQGSKVILTLDPSDGNDMCGFYLARSCSRIQVKDFIVDYTPGSIKQFGGQLIALDKVNRTFTVQVDANVYANLAEVSTRDHGFFLNEEDFQRVGFQGVDYGMLQSWGDAQVSADTFEFTAESSTWNRYQDELKVGDYFVTDGRGGDLIILFNNVTDFVANNITAHGCRSRYYIVKQNGFFVRSIGNKFLRTGGRLLGAPSGGINDHGDMSWHENIRIEHTRDDSFHCGNPEGRELVLRNSEIDTAFRNSIWVESDRSWVEGNYVENAGINSLRIGPNGAPDSPGTLVVDALIQNNVLVNGRRNGIITLGGDVPDDHTGDTMNERIRILDNLVFNLQSDEAFMLEDLKDSTVVGNMAFANVPGWRIYHDELKAIGFHLKNCVNVAGVDNWVDDFRIDSQDAVVI